MLSRTGDLPDEPRAGFLEGMHGFAQDVLTEREFSDSRYHPHHPSIRQLEFEECVLEDANRPLRIEVDQTRQHRFRAP